MVVFQFIKRDYVKAALAVGVVSLMMLLNARTVVTLTLTSRAENAEKANAQAVAVMEEVKSKILANREFGKNGEVVRIGDTDEDGNWAQVSFAPKSSSNEYPSANNLGEGSQRLGEGDVVLDPGMIQVVAVSKYRNEKVVAYEMVMAPPLPFSLGSSGAVVAGGNSLIGGVDSAGVVADGLDREEELIDGGVVANGGANSGLPAGLEKALTLSDSVEVVGKAKTAGGSVVAPTVNMTRGSVEDITETEELPVINPGEYDPVAKGWEHVPHNPPAVGVPIVVTESAAVYGFHRYNSPTQFNAPLKLNGALIFVEGDVTLSQPLTGTGALVATGKVTIAGGADIKADSLAAVVAGGDLTVTGARDREGNLKSQFTGLLYSGGNLTLNDTRTIGSAIAAGTTSGGSVMSIQNSEFIASPEGQDVSIVIQDFAGEPDEGGRSNFQSAEAGDSEGALLMPSASDLYVDGSFITDPVKLRERIKIVYQGRIYTEETLPASAPGNLRISITRALPGLLEFAQDLEAQNAREPVQVVKFDLNEFLNVSDRLKSSRPYYIED